MFVFRNNTIERFFPKDYQFSGYADISNIPADVDGYVWFYQIPIKYEQEVLVEEIHGYARSFEYVLSQIDPAKTIIALTMELLYHVPFTDDDHRLRMAIDSYNKTLFELAEENLNLKVIDFSEFTRCYPASELIDWKFYFISQMGLSAK